jgi:hypothetical protein
LWRRDKNLVPLGNRIPEMQSVATPTELFQLLCFLWFSQQAEIFPPKQQEPVVLFGEGVMCFL